MDKDRFIALSSQLQKLAREIESVLSIQRANPASPDLEDLTLLLSIIHPVKNFDIYTYTSDTSSPHLGSHPIEKAMAQVINHMIDFMHKNPQSRLIQLYTKSILDLNKEMQLNISEEYLGLILTTKKEYGDAAQWVRLYPEPFTSKQIQSIKMWLNGLTVDIKKLPENSEQQRRLLEELAQHVNAMLSAHSEKPYNVNKVMQTQDELLRFLPSMDKNIDLVHFQEGKYSIKKILLAVFTMGIYAAVKGLKKEDTATGEKRNAEALIQEFGKKLSPSGDTDREEQEEKSRHRLKW